MTKVFFDGAGFEAEKLLIQQFEGKLTNKKEHQYVDIDAFIKSKSGKVNAISVKDQYTSARDYNCIVLEMKLINTRTNESTDGCVPKCKAKDYFWRVWTEEHGDTWLIIPSKRLKKYIKENSDKLIPYSTRPETEAKNRKYNRFYDRTEGFRMTMDIALTLGKTKPVEGGIKH